MNTRLVNSAAGVVNAALTQNRTAAGIAVALESAGLLMGPDTAAELARLRQYAEHKQSREEELLATLGQYNLVTSPDAWALGMTVISHLEGPHTPSSPEELEPGLRKLIEQLQRRVSVLESRIGTAQAMHVKHSDSEHCQYDDGPWPCPTVVALEGTRADAEEPPPVAAGQTYVWSVNPNVLAKVTRVWAAGGDEPFSVAFDVHGTDSLGRPSVTHSALPMSRFRSSYYLDSTVTQPETGGAS